MIRLIASVIILTLLITYLIIPLVRGIRGVSNSELKRIDKAFTEETDKYKRNEE